MDEALVHVGLLIILRSITKHSLHITTHIQHCHFVICSVWKVLSQFSHLKLWLPWVRLEYQYNQWFRLLIIVQSYGCYCKQLLVLSLRMELVILLILLLRRDKPCRIWNLKSTLFLWISNSSSDDDWHRGHRTSTCWG